MPRPPPAGGAAGAAAPRPAPAPAPRPAPGAAAPAAGAAAAVLKFCDTDKPLTHTSAVLLTRPSETVMSPALCGATIVRVNQTTPSKSSRPWDSQLPGTCMSFQSLERDAL